MEFECLEYYKSLVDDFDCVALGAQVDTEAHVGPLLFLERDFKFVTGVRLSQMKLEVLGGENDVHDTVLLEDEQAGVDVVFFVAMRPRVAIVGEQVTAMT